MLGTRARRHLLWPCVAMVFIIRIALLLVIHHWSMASGREGFSPLFKSGDDGGFYYYSALDIADGSDVSVVNLYPRLLGYAMRVTGVTDIFPHKLVNCLIGCGSVLLALAVYRLLAESRSRRGRDPFDARAATLVIVLVGLFPSEVMFTTVSLLRDAWIYVLHLLAVYFCLLWLRSRSVQGKLAIAPLLVALLALLQGFRWYACMSVLIGIAIWAAAETLSCLRRRQASVQPAVILVAVLSVVVWVAGSQDISPGSERLQSLQEYRSGWETSDAGSNMRVDLTTTRGPILVPLYAYSFVSNVFGPLPFQVNSIQTLLVMLIETPVLVMVATLIWRKRRYLKRESMFLLCQAIAWFVLIAYFSDNLGTAARLRVIGWNCLFIVYAHLVSVTRPVRCRTAATPSAAAATAMGRGRGNG